MTAANPKGQFPIARPKNVPYRRIFPPARTAKIFHPAIKKSGRSGRSLRKRSRQCGAGLALSRRLGFFKKQLYAAVPGVIVIGVYTRLRNWVAIESGNTLFQEVYHESDASQNNR